MLWVDHASVRVESLDRAALLLQQRLGLIPTRTPGAEQQHSRLFFHRSYLEVSEGNGPASPPAAAVELFFFGFSDLERTCAQLRAADLRFRSEPYQGRDGLWDNLEVEAPPGVPSPILVRRVLPREVAADWPPSRPQPWPCGARAVRGFHLEVTALEPAAAFFRALLGAPASPAPPHPLTGVPRVRLDWEGGLLLLQQGPAPGVVAVVLESVDLALSARFLADRGTPARVLPEGLWVDPLLPGLGLVLVAQGVCPGQI
ncbi:MAG: VOC family protein [Myxococcota bacterium]|nr:VOC family protein [Myxococcota bacterium]